MARRIILVDIGNGLSLSGVLPSVALNADYSARLIARGGVAPYRYEAIVGADLLAAAGLYLDAGTGTISGTASAAGNIPITVRATDLSGAHVDRPFAIVVVAEPIPLAITGAFAAATIGTPYSSDLAITGGSGGYSNPRVTVGSLAGTGLALTIVGSVLRLSGTPTGSAGTLNVTVAVDSGDGQTAISPQSITVDLGIAATWNPADKNARLALAGGNLTVLRSYATQVWLAARATLGRDAATANHYFELSGNNYFTMLGLMDSAVALADTIFPGDNQTKSWSMYLYSGDAYTNNAPHAYAPGFMINERLGVLLRGGKLYFRRASGWIGSADIVAGTGFAFSGLTGTLFPAVGMFDNQGTSQVVGYFSPASFTLGLPAGASAWGA